MQILKSTVTAHWERSYNGEVDLRNLRKLLLIFFDPSLGVINRSHIRRGRQAARFFDRLIATFERDNTQVYCK